MRADLEWGRKEGESRRSVLCKGLRAGKAEAWLADARLPVQPKLPVAAERDARPAESKTFACIYSRRPHGALKDRPSRVAAVVPRNFLAKLKRLGRNRFSPPPIALRSDASLQSSIALCSSLAILVGFRLCGRAFFIRLLSATTTTTSKKGPRLPPGTTPRTLCH